MDYKKPLDIMIRAGMKDLRENIKANDYQQATMIAGVLAGVIGQRYMLDVLEDEANEA